MVSSYFGKHGFPLIEDNNIVPDDETTLFVCSGMQRVRNRFKQPDGTKYGSLQSCIRTTDLDLVGDGTHLTFFQMLGNFSFGGNDYESSVELWDNLLRDFDIKVDSVHVHPDKNDHKQLWLKRGYEITDDTECVWSDGDIGGYCCEIYSNGIEIGNLVNPLGHSTDVGFGWERLFMMTERTGRVDETSLFPSEPNPIVRDHVRTLDMFWKNGIKPGTKRREYVCRRLVRRLLRHDVVGIYGFDEWIKEEQKKREICLNNGRKLWKRNQHQSLEWWWTTIGILPDEIPLIQ